jgi:hypothetical protein
LYNREFGVDIPELNEIEGNEVLILLPSPRHRVDETIRSFDAQITGDGDLSFKIQSTSLRKVLVDLPPFDNQQIGIIENINIA